MTDNEAIPVKRGSKLRLVPKTRGFAAPAGTIAVVRKPLVWSNISHNWQVDVKFPEETSQAPGGYRLEDFQIVRDE